MADITHEECEEILYFMESDSNKTQSPKSRLSRIHSDSPSRDDSRSPVDWREILERLTHEENESKEIKQSLVRKLTADMTERGRKLGAHLESIHGYVVKECTNIEESQDQYLSDELADELRKRTTSVDTEIKQLENQMGQLQRTLVKGKARRESLRHRMSVTSPSAGRKVSAISSCSSTSEVEELTLEDYKAKIEMLENEKLEWLEDKKDLGEEIKFLKYQLQYRLEVQSLQNDNNDDKSELDKVVQENETLREENCNLKERLTTIKDKLKEKGNVEESLLSIADVSNQSLSGVSSENELERLNIERKILLSTIMRMQSLEKDEDEAPSFADFGVQVELNKLGTIEEDAEVTPLVAKLTEENKALKKHITDMQKDLDEHEEERKAMSEENFKLIDEKRSLEDTINKLRTQMSDTLDTTLDEIEQLHSFNEELEAKSKRTEVKFKELLQVMDDLQNRNCKFLESMLDEVENKLNIEEIFDFLDNEVTKIIDQNRTSFPGSEPKLIEPSTEEKQFSSNLLNEVKSCKDLLESQRSHIRKLQLDKRDIEEGYTKMKREVLLLKSSKQRARENSKELQFLKKRRAKSLNDGAQEAKAVFLDKEYLQREVRRLSSVKEELENSVQKLKKEKATLEDEKVCLLGSLYHQLERNESLEMQIEELSVALAQWESKSDLESDVFTDVKNERDLSPDKKSPDVVAIEKDADESQDFADESTETPQIPNNELNVEQVSGRPTSPVVTAVGSAADESMDEKKQKIHALGEQLQAVQDSVVELEIERDNLLAELEDSKKNEKELRNVIVQLKRENSIHEDKLAKSNDLAETLQVRLEDAQTAKSEAMELLEEAKAEKEVSKKHCAVLDNRLKEATEQRNQHKAKAVEYYEYLKELYACVTEMVQTDSSDESSSKTAENDEDCIQSDVVIQSGIYKGFGAIQSSINEMMHELNKSNEKVSALKSQVESSNTDKEALQKSVREAEAKKKQLKGFITKLTEEKEKVMEQIDEMKQQKSNLADALENVYQSKEKLQNRLSESLFKQQQFKKSLAESTEEAKTLRESLYRMVNEHETMKESLLTANREVERLKSQHRLHTGTNPINVIMEEDDYDSEDQGDTDGTSSTYADTLCNVNINNLRYITDRLKEAMCLLTNRNSLFDAELRKLKADAPMDGEKDKQAQGSTVVNKETSMEPASGKSDNHSTANGTEDEVNDKGKENNQDKNGIAGNITGDVTENKGKENDVVEDYKSKDEETVNKKSKENINTEEIPNKEVTSTDGAKQIKEEFFKCFSEMQSKDEETFSFINAQISELEKLIVGTPVAQQRTEDELDDNEAISGLIELQEDLLTKKLNSDLKQTEDNRQLVQWFEVISQEKENLGKDLKNASQDNIKLLEDLASLREENQKLTHQLERRSKERDSSEVEVKETDSTKVEDGEQQKSADVQEDRDVQTVDATAPEEFDLLEELDALDLKDLVKKLQGENKLLNNKICEMTEASQHFNAIEQELEKSNDETKALEKQVEVLSKEGANLRGEADERVQRLIELEENMILTIEKKLELAEYASMLTSKKDILERKCEQLSREVEGLKESRDQMVALKSQSDEEMRSELAELEQFKDRAVREIEDLNDILRIGRQDFEAMKIELESMQRKNKSLKQELDKASAREEEIASNFQEKLSDALARQSSSDDQSSSVEMELLKIKLMKLESDIVAANEKVAKLQKERDDLVLLLTDLINVYEAEAKNKEDQRKEIEESLHGMGSVVAEMKTWIKSTSDAVFNCAHKTKMLDSLVQEVEEKTSEVLADPSKLASSTPIEEHTIGEEGSSKTSYDNACFKLELLINKLNESVQNQTNYETQLDQIKEDNERITKELEVKSNFLKTMRDSFEQVLQERNLLAQKLKSHAPQQAQVDGPSHHTQIFNGKLKEIVECHNCKKLERERDELKSIQESMNEESAKLRDKCHLLKENLLRLKQQQESIMNNNITAECADGKRADPFEEQIVEDVLIACQSAPVFVFETDFLEKPSPEPSMQEDLKTQIQAESNKEEEIKDNEPSTETDQVIQGEGSGDDLQSQIKQQKDEIKRLQDTNKNLETEIASLKEKIKEIKLEHNRETTELKKEFLLQEHELGELSKEKEQRKELIASLKTKIDGLKNTSPRKEHTPTTRKSSDDIEEESTKLRKMLAERSTSLKDLNEKLGVSKNFMQKILDENRDLKEDVTNYELEEKEMRKEIEVLKAEADLKKTVLLELKDDKFQLEAKKNRLEEDLTSVKEQLRTRGALLATLEKDRENFKGNLRKANQEVESLKKQYELLQELSESGKQRQKDTEVLVRKLKQSCDEMTVNLEKVTAEKKRLEETLTEELQNERRKNEEYKDKIEDLNKMQTSMEKSVAEHKEKCQNLTRELRRDKSRRDRQIDSIKQENMKILAGEARLQKELENLREQLDDERSKNDKLESDLKSAIIHNLTLNNSLKVQSEEKDKTSKELEGNRKESKRLNTLTGDLKSKMANLEALLKSAKDEKKFMLEEIDKVKTLNNDLRLRLNESGEDKEELEDILVEMREKRQKLHNEIDKALTERDELEDELIDLKKEVTKKLQASLEEHKITEVALEKALQREITLQHEIKQLNKTKSEALAENSTLKDNLEEAKTDLISHLQSTVPSAYEEATSSESNEQLQKAQCEIERLNSLLEKSQKEKETLKTKPTQPDPKESADMQEPIKGMIAVVQTEKQFSSFVGGFEKTSEHQAPDPELFDYKDENIKLRVKLEEAESKALNLKDELYNQSKKQVQEEFNNEAFRRKCKSLEEDLQKSQNQLVKTNTRLLASNANVTDLRKSLREALANKDKFESEYKRLLNEKGAVEKVKVKSIEVPFVPQMVEFDKDIPVAKAESLESARKEIVIIEAQVKDMRERTKQDRELVEQLLYEINNELTRALNVFGINPEMLSEGSKESDTAETRRSLLLNYHDLQDKLGALRMKIDSLEQGHLKPVDESFIEALPKEDQPLSEKFTALIKENNKLTDKLQFMQERLSAVLQEKEVLEDIGSSTRKELRSLVKSLSIEREQMKSLSTERSKMKLKLAEAEKKIEELNTTMKSLRNEKAQSLQDQNLTTVPEIKVEAKEVVNVVQAIPVQEELDLKAESKHLEMELMEQDRELQWLKHECKELRTDRDHLKQQCKKLQDELNKFEAAHKKLDTENQELYDEMRKKDRYLSSYREDNEKLLTIQKTSEAQIRHLNREIELFSDRVVCCETEKEQIEETNRRQNNEIQELVLHKTHDNVAREKLEQIFYENTKVKEQKKMLSTRLQTLERDMKSQILTARDLEAEKEELLNKIDKTEGEIRNEITKKERYAYLLDKHENDSRIKIDSLSRLVAKLKHDKDELCGKDTRLDKIHQENNKLSKECTLKDGVIKKLQDENNSLKKENDAFRRSHNKLKESQRMLQPPEGKGPSLERSNSLRLPSRKASSKTSSHSSIDRASVPSSRASTASERRDSRSRTPPARRSSRSSSMRRSDKTTPAGDLTGGGSQECFCSPILSVVNLCPYEVQQGQNVDESGLCPVCKKRKTRKSGMIKEHYV